MQSICYEATNSMKFFFYLRNVQDLTRWTMKAKKNNHLRNDMNRIEWHKIFRRKMNLVNRRMGEKPRKIIDSSLFGFIPVKIFSDGIGLQLPTCVTFYAYWIFSNIIFSIHTNISVKYIDDITFFLFIFIRDNQNHHSNSNNKTWTQRHSQNIFSNVYEMTADHQCSMQIYLFHSSIYTWRAFFQK